MKKYIILIFLFLIIFSFSNVKITQENVVNEKNIQIFLNMLLSLMLLQNGLLSLD
ncbi:hypothetical protein [Marinitoga lauensis]|uniref:hypothetical protein n=1 Tax=Marinitoga lauensis TaxID=2201189 RepID=UPI001404DD4B|nr:hypothetical protein [Marinitoga lauensis]